MSYWKHGRRFLWKDLPDTQLCSNAIQIHFADVAVMTLVVVETVVTVNLVTENFPLDTPSSAVSVASETLPPSHAFLTSLN